MIRDSIDITDIFDGEIPNARCLVLPKSEGGEGRYFSVKTPNTKAEPVDFIICQSPTGKYEVWRKMDDSTNSLREKDFTEIGGQKIEGDYELYCPFVDTI